MGAQGQVSRQYNLDMFYVTPKVRIESVGIFQRGVKEHGGTYNLELDNLNGFMNSGYVGADIGKVIPVKKGAINLALVLGLKQELNSIDDTVKFKIKSLGDETGEIDIKNKNRFSQEVGVKTEVGTLWNGLSLYGEYKYIFSKDNSWKVTGGISLKF